MQVRNIMLAITSVLIVVGFAMLVFSSDAQDSGSVDDDELSRALNSYKRNHVQDVPTQTKPTTSSPRARPNSEKEVAVEHKPSPPPDPEKESDVFKAQDDLKSQMNEANRLYDKAEYEGARDAAIEILIASPENVRMKRIVVSSSCIMGDEDIAAKYYEDLPPRDQRQMDRRCKRYGIVLE